MRFLIIFYNTRPKDLGPVRPSLRTVLHIIYNNPFRSLYNRVNKRTYIILLYQFYLCPIGLQLCYFTINHVDKIFFTYKICTWAVPLSFVDVLKGEGKTYTLCPVLAFLFFITYEKYYTLIINQLYYFRLLCAFN